MQSPNDTLSQDPGTPRKPLLNPEEDGRNIEWEDRARVNLERVPEDTSTNIERDFEEEDTDDSKNQPNDTPAY